MENIMAIELLPGSTRNPYNVIDDFEKRCKWLVNKIEKDTPDGHRLQTRLHEFRCFTRRLNDISGCERKIKTLADMITAINQEEYKQFMAYAKQEEGLTDREFIALTNLQAILSYYNGDFVFNKVLGAIHEYQHNIPSAETERRMQCLGVLQFIGESLKQLENYPSLRLYKSDIRLLKKIRDDLAHPERGRVLQHYIETGRFIGISAKHSVIPQDELDRMIHEVKEKYKDRLMSDYNSDFDRQQFVKQSILEQNERENQSRIKSKSHKHKLAFHRFKDRIQSLDITKTVDDLYGKLTSSSGEFLDKNWLTNTECKKIKSNVKSLMNDIGRNPHKTTHLQERMRSIDTIKSLRVLLNSADQINPNDSVENGTNEWKKDYDLDHNMTTLLEASRVGRMVSINNDAIELFNHLEARYQRQLRFVTRLTHELLPSVEEAYQIYIKEAKQEVHHDLVCRYVNVTDKNEQIELLKQMAGLLVTHFRGMEAKIHSQKAILPRKPNPYQYVPALLIYPYSVVGKLLDTLLPRDSFLRMNKDIKTILDARGSFAHLLQRSHKNANLDTSCAFTPTILEVLKTLSVHGIPVMN
ncbi:hypothetical protein N9N03_01570 [Chlamydiia bacterium]|nr:hypothetical protein [Chlamydiia bacterium]